MGLILEIPIFQPMLILKRQPTMIRAILMKETSRVYCDPNTLIEGTNVIAVEMHDSRSSSDMVMEIELETKQICEQPLKITEPMTVKARSFNNNEWSAIATASFTCM